MSQLEGVDKAISGEKTRGQSFALGMDFASVRHCPSY